MIECRSLIKLFYVTIICRRNILTSNCHILTLHLFKIFLFIAKRKPELFPAIKQENYIPDELHLLLCISDVLMECFFNDLFKKKDFERLIKNQIEQTMKSIKVHFEFFKSKSHSGKWDWTSLMGPDKKKVLQHFPVTNFILEKRGEDIQKLWCDFIIYT